MFNGWLFFLLTIVCIPGLLVAVPRTLSALESRIKQAASSKKSPPSRATLLTLALLQSLALVAVFNAIGTTLAPKVGLGAPFFEALVAREGVWAALAPQLLPALALGTMGGLLFVAAYFWIFRPRLDPDNIRVSESLRRQLGLAGRLLYGGVVEEVLTRWGLMTLLAWLFQFVFGPSSATFWLAILLSGLLFGLGHLPSHLGVGGRITPMLVGTVIVLNLWAAVLFGWLYWQIGLAAAMLAHMLFHLVWYPFDRAR